MQLLVLKVLYILFNTKGLSEYFYTNDLCVLVDVFLREIVDLDEESESVCYWSDCMPGSNFGSFAAPTHIPPCAASPSHQNTTALSAV